MLHNEGMVRPCFLIIDQEYSGNISTRKLVIETAKFNVITAYSGAEAIATLRKYPEVEGVVLDAGMRDLPCSALVAALKKICPKTPVIVVGSHKDSSCGAVDHYLDSFNPKQLLDLLQQLQPKETAEIEKHDESLKHQG